MSENKTTRMDALLEERRNSRTSKVWNADDVSAFMKEGRLLEQELQSAQAEIRRLREEMLEQKLSWSDLNRYSQNKTKELEKAEDGLRDIVMMTRPSYDPSDDEGASAESVIGDIKHDVALLKNEKASLIEALVHIQNLINGVHGETKEDKTCLDTAWEAIQKALSTQPAGETFVPWSVVKTAIDAEFTVQYASFDELPDAINRRNEARQKLQSYAPKSEVRS